MFDFGAVSHPLPPSRSRGTHAYTRAFEESDGRGVHNGALRYGPAVPRFLRIRLGRNVRAIGRERVRVISRDARSQLYDVSRERGRERPHATLWTFRALGLVIREAPLVR